MVQSIYLKLSEADANVPSVCQKLQEQLDTEDDIILTDSKGHELHDSNGTQGNVTYSNVIYHTCTHTCSHY